MSNNKLNKLSIKTLNEIYRNGKVVFGQYFGEIIHIWYGSNLGDGPQAEIRSLLNPEDTKIIPLSKVILVAGVV